MSERKDDKKPQKFFQTLRQRGKERLNAFIYKSEEGAAEELELPSSIENAEPPKHPLYAFWIMWQQDTYQQKVPDIDISEEAFLSWFGHDIDLVVKNEPEDLEEADEPEPNSEEEPSEEEPKPTPTPAQLFCDSLTSFADDYLRGIQLEYRLAETELQMTREKLQAEALEKAEQAACEEDAKMAVEEAEVLDAEELDDESTEDEDPEENHIGEELEEESVLVMKPRDAIIKAYISSDNMSGFVFLFPPLFGGKAADNEAIQEALKKAHIRFGIDTQHVEQILPQNGYLQLHSIAQGLFPVDGIHGQIIDYISRTETINVMEDEHGLVNFKQLNIIQNIKKGEPICSLIPPIPGINGQDVKGKTISCVKATVPKFPQGNNTAVSPDGTQLVATMDGFAAFQYSRFNVESKLVVSGNVDNAVGNINFIGDVYVRGDVLNGFEVRAGGDIHISGMVEGAFLYAGKNVHIEKGMNGNKQGLIVAGGEVHCHFLENCTIHAIGTVQADSMVWCDITSDDSIIAGPGKGAIIGGSVMACNSITAQVIGNKSHQKTNITLGYSNNILREREAAEKDLGESKTILETLLKNINYLSKQKDLPHEKQELLNQLIHQKCLYDVKKKALLNRLADLDNDISDFSKCHINGDMIFPPTQVTIGNASRTISNVWFKCHVYYSEGEIKFGTATD